MKIGLFDSGRGGLLIASAVREAIPEYDYLYYGDTKNVPYGDRSETEIYNFTLQGVLHLFSHDCVLVILACNTASAETLRKLQDEWLPEHYPDRHILGVIIPTIEAVLSSNCTRVLLLATQRTVSAGKYHIELGKRNELHTKIVAQSATELVPLIEANELKRATEKTAAYISLYITRGDLFDGVILGCTHYSLMVDDLRVLFPSIRFFAQTEIIPDKLQSYLTKHTDLQIKLSQNGTLQTYLTDQNN